MKTGFFLTARLGSTRLPRKHLLEAAGKPMLGVLAERIRHAFAADLAAGDALLAIVTSDEAENRAFERFAALGVRVFYGSVDNIPLRHHQAAQVGLHGRHVRLLLGAGELGNGDRSEDTDDDDDDQEFDEREAATTHFVHRGSPSYTAGASGAAPP